MQERGRKQMEKTENKVVKLLHICFMVAFGLAFSLIILNVLFNRNVNDYNAKTISFLFVVSFAFFLFFASCINKRRIFFEKHYTKILLVSVIYIFVIQMIMLVILRFDPIWDMEAIYHGAISWVETGTFTDYTSSTCHADYFYIFPNNLGSLTFLALFFKVANILGFRDYFLVGGVVNGLLLAVSVVLATNISKRFFGAVSAMFTLLFFLCSAPFYMMAPVFYTDALSFVFPLLTCFLILKSESAPTLKAKICFAVLACVACLIGALIKMTVLITLIAVFIWLLLARKWKDLIILVLVSAIVFCAGFSGFGTYMYTNHLDTLKADQKNQPIWFWLNMAIVEEGYFNGKIFQASSDIEGKEAKSDFLKEVYVANIKERGADSLLKLFTRKAARVFGDGTYALSEFLDDRPLQMRGIHQYILYVGNKYGAYRMFTTGIFLALQAFMLFSLNFKKRNLSFILPQLCVFGIMFFLLFWEIKSCYMINFIPFIFICASGGLYQIVCVSGGFFKLMRSVKKDVKKFFLPKKRSKGIANK